MNDPQNWTLSLGVANFALTWGVALYMYLANKSKVTNERIQSLEDDLDVRLGRMKDEQALQAQRITHLETAAEAAPDHADLSKVYDSINALATVVNQLVGENKGQSDTLRLILNQIMQKGMNP